MRKTEEKKDGFQTVDSARLENRSLSTAIDSQGAANVEGTSKNLV